MKGFFNYGVLIDSEGIWGDLFESWKEVCCEFCQYQLEILPQKRVVADPIGTSDQCSQVQV